MPTNNFAPDQIYALGGGGKDLAFTFLQQDWIREEILRPRAANPEQVGVTLIDTATKEVNEDAATVADIQAACDELTESFLTDSSGMPGDIDIERLLLTRDIEMTDSNTLTSPRAVERYCATTGMDTEDWWLGQADIDENLNFAKGVFRQRALAKATYYRAVSERADIENAIDAPEAGSIAIFVGLGGGSGSGILFDIIQTLADKSPNSELTVFGVLPSEVENSDGVHANAYAALGELEALRLSDDDPLKDVVLYPLDPTGYGGKDGNVQDTEPALEEFDTVFAQSIIAYYNAQGENQFNQTPAFAPFTVAVPQAVHYNATAFEAAQDHMEAFLTAHSDALDAERNVASLLGQFFASQGIDGSGGDSLSEADRTYLSQRIRELVAVAEEDLFTEMEFVSRQTFLDQYAEAVTEETTVEEDPVTVITRLQEYLAPLNRANREFKTDLDAQLLDVLLREVDLIVQWADLLQQKNAMTDSKLQAKVGDFTSWAQTPATKLADDAMWMSSRIDALTDDYETVTTALEEAREERAAEERETRDAMTRGVQTWTDQTETARAALAAHDVTEVDDRLRDVEEELQAFADRLAMAESESEVDGVAAEPVMEAVDAVAAYVDDAEPAPALDRTLIAGEGIADAMATLRAARKLTLNIADGPGMVERVLSLATTGSSESDSAAMRDYKDRKRDLEATVCFELTGAPDSFTVRVTFDADTYRGVVDEWIADYRATVADTAMRVRPDAVDELDTSDTDYLLSAVRSGDCAAALEEVFETNFDGDSEAAATIDRLERKAEDIEAERDRYEACYEAVTDIRETHLGAYERAMAAVKDAENAYEQVRSQLSTDEDFIYRKTVQPVNLVGRNQVDSMADAELLDDAAEHQRFAKSVSELLGNVVSRTYCGLVERRLTGAETSYYGTDINVGLLSPVADQFNVAEHGLTDRLAEAFAVKAPGQRSDSIGVYRVRDDTREAVGAPWDFGFHVFISGVFLDNLRFATDRGRTAYEAATAGRDPVHIHHAYQLEEGAVVRRQDHVNVRDEAALELYLGDDAAAIADTLIAEYSSVESIQRSVSELDGGTDDSHDVPAGSRNEAAPERQSPAEETD